MTAAVSLNQPVVNRRDTISDESVSEESKTLSFAGYQARAMSTTMVLMFSLIAGTMYLYRGDAVGSIGLGLFITFWLGGGFGFLIGGILHAVANEEAHD